MTTPTAIETANPYQVEHDVLFGAVYDNMPYNTEITR